MRENLTDLELRAVERFELVLLASRHAIENVNGLKYHTNYHRICIGFLDLADAYGDMLNWAIRSRNKPAVMASTRLILELGTKFNTMLEDPDGREYIATDYLIDFHNQLKNQVIMERPDDLPQEEMKRIQERVDELNTYKTSLKKPKKRIGNNAKHHFTSAELRITKLYNLGYKPSSAYVHAEGFALIDTLSDKMIPPLDFLLQRCAALITLIVSGFYEAYSEVDDSVAKSYIEKYLTLKPAEGS